MCGVSSPRAQVRDDVYQRASHIGQQTSRMPFKAHERNHFRTVGLFSPVPPGLSTACSCVEIFHALTHTVPQSNRRPDICDAPQVSMATTRIQFMQQLRCQFFSASFYGRCRCFADFCRYSTNLVQYSYAFNCKDLIFGCRRWLVSLCN